VPSLSTQHVWLQATSFISRRRVPQIYNPQTHLFAQMIECCKASFMTQPSQERSIPSFCHCFLPTEIALMFQGYFTQTHLRTYVIESIFPVLISLILFQYLKAVLFGKASINCGTSGRHTPKHVLWDVKKTTAGMIATAATIVCF